MSKICVWADKTWAPIEDVTNGEYDHMSDDFLIVNVSDSKSYEETDKYVSDLIDGMTV